MAPIAGSFITDPSHVCVIDSNLSTVTAEADKVLWVDEPEPWIEHIELQAGRDTGLPDRVHYYNTSLGRAHSVPVHSTIVLLRPAADGPDVNGIHERRYRNGDVYDWFRYDVLRIWEQPVEEIFAAGQPVLPLAPVANVEPGKVPEVLMVLAAIRPRRRLLDQAVIAVGGDQSLDGIALSERASVEVFTRRSFRHDLGHSGVDRRARRSIRISSRLEKPRAADAGRAEGAVEEAE